MKKTFRTAMFSTVAMLIVGVMSLTGVTYAWFTQGTEANVQGMTMSVEAADGGVQISKDGINWASQLTLDTNNSREEVKPVSTVDAVKFFSATIDPTNDKKITTAALSTEEYAANVWEEVLYLRNTGTKELTINLGDTAFVAASGDLREAYKAAKLAVFKVTGEGDEAAEELLYIFSDDLYKGVNQAATTSFVYANSGSATQINQPPKLKTDATECTITIPAGEVNEDTGVLESVVKIKVVVWLEGQDEQCVNQNASSSFNLNLFFKNADATE